MRASYIALGVAIIGAAGLLIVSTVNATAVASSEGHIAFAKRIGKFSQLYILNVQTSSARRITANALDHFDPSWSADGRRLAFASRGEDRDGFYPSSITVLDLATGRRSISLHDPKSSSGDLAHAVHSPALSPDGRRLAFTDQGWNIAVVPADRRSTKWRSLVAGTDAAWSPDGRWITFTRLSVGPSNEEGVYLTSRGIWKMRSDGSGLRRLTAGSDWTPALSPDGSRLAFTRRTRVAGDVRWHVNVATSAGRNVRRLAEGSSPTWSPDGRQVAFDRTASIGGDFKTDIYVMAATGSEQRRVVSNAFSPDWGR